MFDKIVYTVLDKIMEWSGKINSWSWRKHVKLVEKKRQQENEEYIKELQKKL